MASGKVGMSGTRISRMLDGTCVKTMVLHQAEARGDPGGESRDAGEEIGAEKDGAEGRLHAEAQVEPPGGRDLDNETAREGVKGEQGGEAEDDGTRRRRSPEEFEQRMQGSRATSDVGERPVKRTPSSPPMGA